MSTPKVPLELKELLEAAFVLQSLASKSKNEALDWLEAATPAEQAEVLRIGRMKRRTVLMKELLDSHADRLAAAAKERSEGQRSEVGGRMSEVTKADVRPMPVNAAEVVDRKVEELEKLLDGEADPDVDTVLEPDAIAALDPRHFPSTPTSATPEPSGRRPEATGS